MFLLKKAIEGTRAIEVDNMRLKVKIFSFHGKRFSPCEHCSGCVRTKGECVIKDDFQELRDKWVDSDIIIYSVPVYHTTIPGQLRCFHDRLGNSLMKRYPIIQEGNKLFVQPRYYLKLVGNIAQGLDIFSGQERALQELVIHSMLMNCIPISGDAYFGVGGWTARSREKNSIESLTQAGDPTALAAVAGAVSVGKRAVQLATILRMGFREARAMLEFDKAYQPVLERLGGERKWSE
jgi:multimeric flavodoxin WrbA